MKILEKNIKIRLTDAGYSLKYFWAVSLIILAILGSDLRAQDNKEAIQEKNQAKQELKNIPFVDEDGDGFNDLLPDSDSDGIPDMIDPDFKGHSAESLYMHRYMNGQTIEAEKNQFQNMFQHGESGQYGPSDSTGHGQHGGEGSGQHDGSGNQGGQGGHGGEGGNGGRGGNGDGGGPGLNAPEIKDNNRASAKAQPNNSPDRDNKPVKIDNNQNQKSGNTNGGGNQGGQGGGRP